MWVMMGQPVMPVPMDTRASAVFASAPSPVSRHKLPWQPLLRALPPRRCVHPQSLQLHGMQTIYQNRQPSPTQVNDAETADPETTDIETNYAVQQLLVCCCTQEGACAVLRLFCTVSADVRSFYWHDCWSSDSRSGSHVGGLGLVHNLQKASLTQQACLHGSQGRFWQNQRVSAPVKPTFLHCIFWLCWPPCCVSASHLASCAFK